MNSNILANLKSVGLPEKVALVYGAVLESGIAFPSKIAETTSLNRSTVYKILSDLRIKGLVTEIERGKKLCYQIEDPSRLQGLTKKQMTSAEERHENAKKILPELQGLFSLLPNKPRVRFFEGMDGILAVYEEHVSVTEAYEMLSYSNVEELMKTLPSEFVRDYVKRKEKIGITTRAIFPQSLFSKEYNKKMYAEVPKDIRVSSRFIPSESFPFQADLTIYGKQSVSIINFHQNILIGVIIEDATIAGMMRMSFELAWRSLAILSS